MEEALELYVTWYSMLVTWASAIVPNDIAFKLASRAMSLMFLRACRGAETDDGPWTASCEELYTLLCRDLSMSSEYQCVALLRDLPRPDDTLMYQMARLYAAVYHSSYSACLTLHGRERIALMISTWRPHCMSNLEIEEYLNSTLNVSHPLRCVFWVFENHIHNGELICTASSELWKSEHLKGRRWLAEGTSRKEVI